MAKIPRKQIFPFASGASNNGVFGSAQLGTKVTTTDIEAIQGISGDAPSAAYMAGWLDAVISGQNLPPLEEMQGIQYLFSTQLSYLFQEGIAEYYTLTTYFQNSIVKKPGTYQLYGSLIDNNQGNALPSAVSDSNWKYIGDLSNLINSPSSVPLLASNDLSDLASLPTSLTNLGFVESLGSSLGSSGYQEFPGGLIVQWGSVSIADNASATVTFPISFPTAALGLLTNVLDTNPVSIGTATRSCWGAPISSTQATLFYEDSSASPITPATIQYLVWGK